MWLTHVPSRAASSAAANPYIEFGPLYTLRWGFGPHDRAAAIEPERTHAGLPLFRQAEVQALRAPELASIEQTREIDLKLSQRKF
jgi:hypothetical protein